MSADKTHSPNPENDLCGTCGHLRFQHDEKGCRIWCACIGFTERGY